MPKEHVLIDNLRNQLDVSTQYCKIQKPTVVHNTDAEIEVRKVQASSGTDCNAHTSAQITASLPSVGTEGTLLSSRVRNMRNIQPHGQEGGCHEGGQHGQHKDNRPESLDGEDLKKHRERVSITRTPPYTKKTILNIFEYSKKCM